MCARRSADEWFADYESSHRHPINELIHWICVPLIFISVLGLIWSLPVPATWNVRFPWFNWALVAIALASLYYAWLSLALSLGLFSVMAGCYFILIVVEEWLPWPLWRLCLATFAAGWIGQFIGHKLEGHKPAFFKDVTFLLIGPARLMSVLYKKIGQRY
jgi:uncharacterized membrane protein YGL010W